MFPRFITLLLSLFPLMSMALRADTLTFEEYDCRIVLPSIRWTIDTSRKPDGMLLDAFMENRIREVSLRVTDAPDGATAINDSGYVDQIVAGIEEKGEITGRGFLWYNNDMCYEVCYRRSERNDTAGARYLLLIDHGRLYTLRFGARFIEPCDDRGFNTIAKSFTVATAPGRIADADIDETEEWAMTMEEENRRYEHFLLLFSLFLGILLLGVPAWFAYFWLTRRKRRMREREFEAELSRAPDVELGRILLNKQEYSIDAVDTAENELTRRRRRDQALEMARNEPRRRSSFAADDAGLRLSNTAIDRRLVLAALAGFVSHLIVLGLMIERALSGRAVDDSAFIICTIVIWGAVGLLLSHGVRQKKMLAAAALIPSLLFLPLWSSLHLETLSLLPLLLLALPAFPAIRAIDDSTIKRQLEVDLSTVGWDDQSDGRNVERSM